MNDVWKIGDKVFLKREIAKKLDIPSSLSYVIIAVDLYSRNIDAAAQDASITLHNCALEWFEKYDDNDIQIIDTSSFI